MKPRRDLPLAQTVVIGQLHGVPLGFGKRLHQSLKNLRPLMGTRLVVAALVVGGLWLVFRGQAQALLGAVVSLAAAHFVDRPASGDGDHPAERFALRPVVGRRAVPNLEKRGVQEIIDIVAVIHDPAQDRPEKRAVAMEKDRERGFVAILNPSHQLLVRGLHP